MNEISNADLSAQADTAIDDIATLSDRTRANTILINELRNDVKQIRADTADIIETFKALAGGFKVLTALGRLARPIGWIAGAAAAVIALWAAIHGGGK